VRRWRRVPGVPLKSVHDGYVSCTCANLVMDMCREHTTWGCREGDTILILPPPRAPEMCVSLRSLQSVVAQQR
jgi:hypothetical protein